jgi:hypothetical protein
VGPPGHYRGAVSRLGTKSILSVWSAGARVRMDDVLGGLSMSTISQVEVGIPSLCAPSGCRFRCADTPEARPPVGRRTQGLIGAIEGDVLGGHKNGGPMGKR